MAEDYGEWTAWVSSARGDKSPSVKPHHRWACESDIAARVILQYLKDRGMAVKDFPDTPPDSIWIHIGKRKDVKRSNRAMAT